MRCLSLHPSACTVAIASTASTVHADYSFRLTGYDCCAFRARGTMELSLSCRLGWSPTSVAIEDITKGHSSINNDPAFHGFCVESRMESINSAFTSVKCKSVNVTNIILYIQCNGL